MGNLALLGAAKKLRVRISRSISPGEKAITRFAKISRARREEIENSKTFATFKRKIPDIVKAEGTQTDCFMCHEPMIERLPFLED